MTSIIKWTGASGRQFVTRAMTHSVTAFCTDIADAGGSVQHVEQEA